MNIGILDQTTDGWSAGASFTRMMLACIHEYLQHDTGIWGKFVRGAKRQSRNEVFFISRSDRISPGPSIRTLLLEGSGGFVPNAASWGDTKLDVILPVRDSLIYEISGTRVAWIPDFQHFRLPELFTETDRKQRDGLIYHIGHEAKLILLSSEQAKRDFQEFESHFAPKVRVASFPSILWATGLTESPQEVVGKYCLPEKFVFVPNQFWKHKNHAILPPALALLRRTHRVNLVLSGLPCDYRDLANSHLSAFFQDCSRHGIHDQVFFLGHLPYQEMVSLMRCAAATIQPSLFEGWSTSIEDAKAIGCPLICSDIPVHREQAPEALGYFQPDSPEALAELLEKVYSTLGSGPNPARERKCLASARKRSAIFGQRILEIAVEAVTGPQANARS